MSIIEQVKELRDCVRRWQNFESVSSSEPFKLLSQAADTIESLSDKLQAENIERSADCGGWIPCKERLPEERIDVLVSFEDNHAPLVAWYSSVNNHWKNACTDSVIKAKVMAWQPLPEPYHEP